MISNQSISVLRWSSLQFTIRWAYCGAPGAFHINTRHNDGASAWLLERGTVQLRINRGTWTASAGQWIVYPPGPAAFDFSDDAEIVSIHFFANWIDGQPLFDLQQPVIAEATKYPALLRQSRQLVRFFGKRFPNMLHDPDHTFADLETYLRLQMLSQHWLSAMARMLAANNTQQQSMGIIDPRAAEAKRLIEQGTPDVAFIERDLPKKLNLSSSHLDRIYVAAFGETPRSFAERCRINWAENALAKSNASIKQIAMRLGFRHGSHFTHWFSKLTNMTPRDFRTHRQSNA